jgi:hypothetical protein
MTPATPPERNVRRLQMALCQRDRELRRVQTRCKALEEAAAAEGAVSAAAEVTGSNTTSSSDL